MSIEILTKNAFKDADEISRFRQMVKEIIGKGGLKE